MTKLAIFAAGCFWGIEEKFLSHRGVLNTEVGYTGGITSEPSYHDVCSGETGHAEAVRVKFDQGIVSYEELVSLFFEMHDPTSLNRQGLDIGLFTLRPPGLLCGELHAVRGDDHAAALTF